MPALVPSSLARRFALAAAGIATGALIVTFAASWWLMNRQHEQQLRQLGAKEREFHAAVLASQLREIASRMSDVAGSSIVAAGLTAEAGRPAYLDPFLAGIRQINGVPVEVLVTDAAGSPIGSNTGVSFSTAVLDWARRQAGGSGRAGSVILEGPRGHELVAVEPLAYPGLPGRAGMLLYKVALGDLHRSDSVKLEWGEPRPGAAPGDEPASVPLPVPPPFESLKFRLRGPAAASLAGGPAPEYETIALIALLLFSVVALSGASLAKVLTRDLHALEAFSSRFIGSGLGTERAPVSGSDEVASLARAINDMLDRLNQQHTALLRDRQKLAEMAEALRAADRRKDEFLAMLAHELRNPLAPILAGAELLRRAPASDARLANVGEIITRQTRHMTKIVDDLLDVSRVTRGLVTLDKAPIEFGSVVSAAVDQVRPLIDMRHHELTVELPDHPVEIFGDHSRLVQVVSNILNNAAKYTPPFGRIRLKVVTTTREVSFSVEDNGTGIAPELMPELFDPFSQGSRAIDRAQGGLGLGLALVKNLVALHGGSVRAYSEGAGRGALFIVRLPRPATQLSGPRALTATALPFSSEHDDTRVLVVDDNVDAAQTLATLLQLDGHTVRVAYDGRAALEQARREHFDVFMLDIGLPGMDGFQLARSLRGLPRTRHALLIAITGYGQPGDRAKSVAAGFDEHLVKPIQSETLRALLARRARAPRARSA